MLRAINKVNRTVKNGLLITIVLVISGCASIPTGNQQVSNEHNQVNNEHSGCNSIESGMVGALIGGLIGAVTHGERGAIVGAVAGAAAGSLGCVLYNAKYHSERVASAQTVDRNYMRTHGGQLPVHTKVTGYTSVLQPNSNVAVGHNADLESKITVVRGRDVALPEVKEQVILLAPDGSQLTKFTKSSTAVKGSGEYQTSFTFNLPKGIKQGRYIIQTTVIVNGKPMHTNRVPMVVMA